MQPSTTTAGSVASRAMVAMAPSGVFGRGGGVPILGTRGARGTRTAFADRGTLATIPDRRGGALLRRASSTGEGGT